MVILRGVLLAIDLAQKSTRLAAEWWHVDEPARFRFCTDLCPDGDLPLPEAKRFIDSTSRAFPRLRLAWGHETS